tara:strand:- start:1410 stop:1898 length:489 start_codon:yes stop_codon:yes gene_type:complete
MASTSQILESKRKANQKYDAAFFLMHTTYPVVKDPKLLIGIIHNLTETIESAIDSALSYERLLRLIPPYPDNPQFKFNLFREKTMRRNKIPPIYATLLMDLKELIELQKKCPVEFQRGNRYILCNKNYQIKSISLKSIKGYLQQTKEFLDIIDKITRLNRKE